LLDGPITLTKLEGYPLDRPCKFKRTDPRNHLLKIGRFLRKHISHCRYGN